MQVYVSTRLVCVKGLQSIVMLTTGAEKNTRRYGQTKISNTDPRRGGQATSHRGYLMLHFFLFWLSAVLISSRITLQQMEKDNRSRFAYGLQDATLSLR